MLHLILHFALIKMLLIHDDFLTQIYLLNNIDIICIKKKIVFLKILPLYLRANSP